MLGLPHQERSLYLVKVQANLSVGGGRLYGKISSHLVDAQGGINGGQRDAHSMPLLGQALQVPLDQTSLILLPGGALLVPLSVQQSPDVHELLVDVTLLLQLLGPIPLTLPQLAEPKGPTESLIVESRDGVELLVHAGQGEPLLDDLLFGLALGLLDQGLVGRTIDALVADSKDDRLPLPSQLFPADLELDPGG